MNSKAISELVIKKALWKYNNSKFHVQTPESKIHLNTYLNTDYIVCEVPLVEEIIKNVFSKELRSRKIKPDWIVTYPPYGLPLAYALARDVGAKFAYIATKTEAGIKTAVCNFDIKPNDKVIVIGDDMYSGESIKQTINIMHKMDAIVESPIFAIANFSGDKTILGIEVLSVISKKVNRYSDATCPMCKAGSKPVAPRPNWNKLIKK
jgi:orotate phosphoribosyltransferase